LTKPICILHAGTEKTGTTSLQRFLAMNATALAARGVWVPRAFVLDPNEGPYNHILLSTASRLSVSEPDDLQSQLGLSTMEMVHQHRRVVLEALTSERDALSYAPSTIIVSNEHIHSRLRTALDVANAKAILEPYCSEFRVIVYLRCQNELALSVAVTAVRQGATELRRIPDFNTPNGFDEILGVDQDYFDYYRFLQRLEGVFGFKALDVRLYEENSLRDNDVVQDFFSRTGLDIADLPHPGRENASLRQDALLFLLKLNGYLANDPRANSMRGRILAYLALTHHGPAQPVKSSEVLRFMSQFAASNESVRSRWFPERKSLFSQATVDKGLDYAYLSLSEVEQFKFFIELFGRATESS
jgi:hypothetical protein